MENEQPKAESIEAPQPEPQPEGQPLIPLYAKITPDIDRFTAKLICYHEHWGSPATQVEANYMRLLKTTDDPYKRRLTKVGKIPKNLSFGWLSEEDPPNISRVVIINLAGGGFKVNPTDEEKARAENSFVDVLINGKSLIEIPPGEFIGPLKFTDWSNIGLLGREEGIEVLVYAFPK